MKHIITLIFVLCAPLASLAQSDGQNEKILGFQPVKTGIIFQVSSGGCTSRGDFYVKVEHHSDGTAADVTLIRTRADGCHPLLPRGTRVRFSYDEVGLARGEKFVVRNENGIENGWIWPESD